MDGQSGTVDSELPVSEFTSSKGSYDKLSPAERIQVRKSQDESSSGIADFVDRFRTVWDSAPFTHQVLKRNLHGRDDVAQNTALGITTELHGDGVRRHFYEGGIKFSEGVAKEVANRIDQEVALGVEYKLEKGFTVDEIVARCQENADYSDPAATAGVLEGYAATALGQGEIDKALVAISRAQEQRGASQALDAGDWLPRIAMARDPVGLAQDTTRSDRLVSSFDSALEKEGYTFDKASGSYSKVGTSASA